jgi:LysM repeat protein
MCNSRNYYVIRRGDTLSSIAASFKITTMEILSVNRGIDPRRLSVGQIICLPIAPSPFEIIVNIGAKRLTVYRNGTIFREYIVATGKPETPTPTGIFEIVNKEIDPGGPYGTRWLGLSAKGYGIHGTNNPASIGTAASNGCIRMYNEDIEALFDITSVGTIVRILP